MKGFGQMEAGGEHFCNSRNDDKMLTMIFSLIVVLIFHIIPIILILRGPRIVILSIGLILIL